MSIKQPNALTRAMSEHSWLLMTVATIAAFSTYSAMYGFRKPFTAAGYGDFPEFMGLSFKSFIVISQVLGYTISKFAGIKVVSEMGKNRRAIAIVGIILVAELTLLGFGAAPMKLKPLFMFLNGIPLGMVWGLVFSYLEGRKFTELMGVGLCASFIFASGFAKTIGKWIEAQLINAELSVAWMPFLSGLIYLVPLVFFVWLLNQVPEPNDEDVTLRTKREPMNGAQRAAFFKAFAPGLVLLIITYTILTAFRDFRDNFMSNILDALGYEGQPDIFTKTELPVTLGVLLFLGTIMFIKDNRRALLVNHWVIFAGLFLAGASTFAYQSGLISPLVWISLTGFATYMAYIPFNCLLFERMIATFKYVSTAGFLIYLADSFGYLGSVGVLLFKELGTKDLSWLEFFIQFNYSLTAVGCIGTLGALTYFAKRKITVNNSQLNGESATT